MSELRAILNKAGVKPLLHEAVSKDLKGLFRELVKGLQQTDYDRGDNKFVEDTEWNDALKEVLRKIEEL